MFLIDKTKKHRWKGKSCMIPGYHTRIIFDFFGFKLGWIVLINQVWKGRAIMGLENKPPRKKPAFITQCGMNMYHGTIEHLTRTKNAIEGFNRGFEPMLQINKPDV